MFALTPDRLASVENDRVDWQRGWPEQDGQRVPAEVPTGGEPAVAAFTGSRVVPARWFDDDDRLFVSPELLTLVGVSQRTGVAVVVDDYNAPGPEAKRGVLIRGHGTVGSDGWVTVDARKTIEWDGTHLKRHTG